MIGMEAVAPPRVMPENDVGTEAPDPKGDVPLLGDAVAKLSVGPSEKDDVTSAELRGGAALLCLALRRECHRVALWVPCSLRAVGQDEVVDRRPAGRPFRQRGAATELDVVGVRPDGQHDRRRGQIDRETSAVGQIVDRRRCARRRSCRSTHLVSSTTSAGQSTS